MIKKTNVQQILFDTAIILFLFALIINKTVLQYIINDKEFYAVMLKIIFDSSYILILLKIILSKYKIRELLLIMLGAGICFLAGAVVASTTLLYTYLFIIGIKGIEWNHALRVCQRCLLIFMMLIFSLSILEVLPDWVYYSEGRVRHCLGYYYPAYLASSFFYLIAASICLLKDRGGKSIPFIMFVLDFIIYRITASRAGFLCTAFAIILWILVNRRHKRRFWKFFNMAALFSMPVCAIFSFCVCLFYNGAGVTLFFDGLLNNRVRYGHMGLINYGIHLFGQKIEWIGFGGINFISDSLNGRYNYVDNGYLKILFDYGLIILIVVILGYMAAIRYAISEKDQYLCISLISIAVYCIFEPTLIDIGYSPFVLCLGLYRTSARSSIPKIKRVQFIPDE